MISTDVIVVYLALLMHNEPKEDGVNGQRACGLVVRNRVNAGWGEWIQVIKDHDKYSGRRDVDKTKPRVLELGDPLRDESFRRCIEIAGNIVSGMEKDITKGALRYCRLDQCSEEFAEKVVRPTKVNPENGATELIHNRVATVGQQQFFK